MVSKTLTIKESVYEKLVGIKSKEESFSDLFERLAEKEKPDLIKFAGAWNKLSDKEKKRAASRMKKWRKEADKSFGKRVKALA